ncbi:MAG: hypothetical protein AAFY15_02955 [Cyanobacteria bacterium J06648_11]
MDASVPDTIAFHIIFTEELEGKPFDEFSAFRYRIGAVREIARMRAQLPSLQDARPILSLMCLSVG